MFKIKNPEAMVIVRNNMRQGNIFVFEGEESILIEAGKTAEIKWRTWVKYQDDPVLRKFLELDKSVHITDDGEILLFGFDLAPGEEAISLEDMRALFSLPVATFAKHIKELGKGNLVRLLKEATAREKQPFVDALKELLGDDGNIDEAAGGEELPPLPDNIAPVAKKSSIESYE